MTPPAHNRVTEIVASLSEEGRAAPASAEELLPLVYQDLRRLAERYMSRERPGNTLQPTALVHEVYLKLVGTTPSSAGSCSTWGAFISISATARTLGAISSRLSRSRSGRSVRSILRWRLPSRV